MRRSPLGRNESQAACHSLHHPRYLYFHGFRSIATGTLHQDGASAEGRAPTSCGVRPVTRDGHRDAGGTVRSTGHSEPRPDFGAAGWRGKADPRRQGPARSNDPTDGGIHKRAADWASNRICALRSKALLAGPRGRPTSRSSNGSSPLPLARVPLPDFQLLTPSNRVPAPRYKRNCRRAPR